ncbi:hypothetical protein [Anaeromyxobacter sp. SG17]|uniref:hypothetical protein n=1 Tax=Anaeromyxobacter sp. SG17 TaxID=2925405 RepID=UPI001F578A3D|nr:hypothetical protein [Anaeromyxobacter sp. SG17]
MNTSSILAALRGLARIGPRVDALERQVEQLRLALGGIESRAVCERTFRNIQEAEFRVFSQWGEDGIIQYLLGKVPIENRAFVEFGVEDYSESNTRFLLCHDNWRGLILDAGDAHRRFLARTELAWRHSIDAVTAFITRENINSLLADAGFVGDIGLLSVDVDGNDYWILDAIEVISPRILVVEFNSVFGAEHAVTVPYAERFERGRAHSSNLYFGASLPALCALADRKGYRFVGANSAGNDAFFVRADLAEALPALTAREGWVESRFRESRDARGRLTLVTAHRDRLRLISELPVLDLASGRERAIADVFAL